MIPLEAILPANGNDPWKAIKTELQKTLNPRSWESWIRPTRLAYTLDAKIFVAVPSPEFASWIAENFGPAIEAAKQALGLEFSGIEFVEGARGT
jgi:chromosomal replication initiation ATPase DnaA